MIRKRIGKERKENTRLRVFQVLEKKGALFENFGNGGTSWKKNQKRDFFFCRVRPIKIQV